MTKENSIKQYANPIDKVLIYLFDSTLSKILVFSQRGSAEAGVQVPAGTVEYEELPLTAAYRELEEETGIKITDELRLVGEYFYNMLPYKNEIHHRHVYWVRTDMLGTEKWTHKEEATPTRSPVEANLYFISISSASAELIADHGNLVTAAQGMAFKELAGDYSGSE